MYKNQMSLLITRQPAEKLIPALESLQKWKRNYDQIVHTLQQANTKKEEQLQITAKNISQFINKSQEIVKNFIVYTDKSLQKQQKELAIKTDRVKRDRKKITIMSEGKTEIETMFKTPQRSKTVQRKAKNGTKSHIYESKTKNQKKISSFEEKILRQLINQKRKVRQYIAQQEASKLLLRNPQTCQIYIRKAHAQKESQYWKNFEQNFKLQYCEQCDLLFPSSKNFSLIRIHFKKEHNKKADKKDCQILQAKQVYDKLKRRIESDQLVYYKCNCKVRPFKSKEEYIQHVIHRHNGNPPSFSSHFFMGQNPEELILNPYFDQYCVLEEMLIPQIFYCGICDIGFGPASQVYLEHISKSHQENDLKDSLSSHFLKLKSGQNKVSTMTDIYSDIHKNANKKWQKDLYNQKMQESKLNPQERSKIKQANRMKSPMLHKKHKHKNRIINQQKYRIPVLYERTIDSGDLFEDQIKMIEIISNYAGPYICGSCSIDCHSYSQLVEHVSGQRIAHMRSQSLWIRVCIFKVEQRKRADYFLPADPGPQYRDYTFNVPIASEPTRVRQYRRMTYGEFHEFVRMNGACGSTSHNWLHLRSQQ